MASKPPFATGAQVEHAKYGAGSVASCTDQHIVIKFDESGERKFVLEIARDHIKKIDRQPPSEKKARAKSTKSRSKKKAAEEAPAAE